MLQDGLGRYQEVHNTGAVIRATFVKFVRPAEPVERWS